MRTRATCALLIAAFALFPPQTTTLPGKHPPDVNPQYFPVNALSDFPRVAEFEARWFAVHLRAMGEPSLYQDSRDTARVEYRFLWLRTVSHPIAIRMEIHTGGPNELNVVEMTGQGGYSPGTTLKRQSSQVSDDDSAQFTQLLDRSKFWLLPTQDAKRGFDGADWIMEGIRNGNYHVVVRWSPDKKSDYRALCLNLVALSQLKIDAKEIY